MGSWRYRGGWRHGWKISPRLGWEDALVTDAKQPIGLTERPGTAAAATTITASAVSVGGNRGHARGLGKTGRSFSPEPKFRLGFRAYAQTFQWHWRHFRAQRLGGAFSTVHQQENGD